MASNCASNSLDRGPGTAVFNVGPLGSPVTNKLANPREPLKSKMELKLETFKRIFELTVG